MQILLSRAQEDYPKDSPPPLRFIRSCSSSLAAPTLHKLEAMFKVPVLEVSFKVSRLVCFHCTPALPRFYWVTNLVSGCCFRAGLCNDRGLTPDDFQPPPEAWSPQAW